MRKTGWAVCGCAVMVALAVPAVAEEQQVNVYNWADYIGKTTVADFQKPTGINVVYDTYDSDAGLEAKVMASESGYDVVTTSTDFFFAPDQGGCL